MLPMVLHGVTQDKFHMIEANNGTCIMYVFLCRKTCEIMYINAYSYVQACAVETLVNDGSQITMTWNVPTTHLRYHSTVTHILVVTLVQTDPLLTSIHIEVSMCVMLDTNDKDHEHAKSDIFSVVSSLVEESVLDPILL